MKNMLLVTALLGCSLVNAGELKHFNDVRDALENGQSVRIAVDFSHCQASGQLFNAMQYAMYVPSAVALTGGVIAASLTHFTLNNPAFPGTPVYEFARYTLRPTNEMELSIDVLRPGDFTPLTQKVTLHCVLGTGAKVYA